jgi:4-carboxymuconolactone decarboxylase
METFDKGLKLRKQVLGAAHVERSLASGDNDFTRDLQRYVTGFGWGEIWARPGLTLRERSLLNLAMLTALNRPHELRTHIRGALNNGVTQTEMREVFLQTIAYCGFPAAIDSFRVASEVLAEDRGQTTEDRKGSD